jgi:8-amino-7-oxononanoate synthase
MATHDRSTLDAAMDIFAQAKRAYEREHGPLPGPE